MTDTHEKSTPITVEEYIALYKETKLFPFLAQAAPIMSDLITEIITDVEGFTRMRHLLELHPEIDVNELTFQDKSEKEREKAPLAQLRKVLNSYENPYEAALRIRKARRLSEEISSKPLPREKKDTDKKTHSAQEKNIITRRKETPPLTLAQQYKKNLLEAEKKNEPVPLERFSLPDISSWDNYAQLLMRKIHHRFIAVSNELEAQNSLPMVFISIYNKLIEKNKNLQTKHFTFPAIKKALESKVQAVLDRVITSENVIEAAKNNGKIHGKYLNLVFALYRSYDDILESASLQEAAAESVGPDDDDE